MFHIIPIKIIIFLIDLTNENNIVLAIALPKDISNHFTISCTISPIFAKYYP